jgi:hypothetical protein
MKKTFTQSLCSASLFLAGVTCAQTGAVSLKDGTGTVISSHVSITAAYAAIPATLAQAYTIELTSSYNGGSETYPIVFTAKTGASAANSITLRPAAGVTTISVQGNVSANNVLTLNDADYVIIDGRPGGTGNAVALTFLNQATNSSANTLQLINGACFNTIRNCNIINSTTTNTGRAVSISTSASNPTGNSDNEFRYCTISGGRYQFNNGGTAASPNTRTRIFGCTFKNSNFAAYWGQAGSAKVRFDSCSFFCTTPISETLYFGILFDSQADSAIIVNNRFYDIQGSSGTLRYIHIRSVLSSGTNVAEIRNNFFSMMTGNASVANLGAIELSTGANLFTARVAHNSVRLGGALGSGGTAGNVGSSGLLISATNTTSAFEIKNNLFVNERSGGTAGLQHLGMAITNTLSAFNIAGNTYNATSGNLVRWGGTAYTTIAGYQAVVTGGEPTANDFPVQFVSANNLHLTCATAASPSLSAVQLPGITTDIDGDPRGATTVRGADEVVSVSAMIGVPTNATCNGISNGSVTVTASAGTAPYTYTWSPSGGNAATATGLAAGNYTVTVGDAGGCTTTKTVTITQPAAVDASTTLNGAIITANATGAIYQWLNCSDNTPLAGQTAKTFTPSANGSYKVVVTVGACTNTSTCVNVSTVGMDNYEAAIMAMQIFPNPGTGVYTLSISENAEITVSNVIGEIVLKQNISKGNTVLDLEKQTAGIYSVSIITGGRSAVVKLIKQ